MPESINEKYCASCGRIIEKRKMSEHNWAQLKYCSSECQRDKLEKSRRGILLEETIVQLLFERERGKTICPSEVVRLLYPENWQDKMEDVRRAARRLVHKNVIMITQKNQAVDVNAKGPIRLKLKT